MEDIILRARQVIGSLRPVKHRGCITATRLYYQGEKHNGGLGNRIPKQRNLIRPQNMVAHEGMKINTQHH